MSERQNVELDLLADWLSLISSKIAANYDKARSGEYELCDELSRSLVLADTLILKLRHCAKLADFQSQEAKVIDMLLASKKLLDKRRNSTDCIGYISGPEGA